MRPLSRRHRPRSGTTQRVAEPARYDRRIAVRQHWPTYVGMRPLVPRPGAMSQTASTSGRLTMTTQAPRRPVARTVGGITFDDPHAWLEEEDTEVLAWQAGQTARTLEDLRAWPHLD